MVNRTKISKEIRRRTGGAGKTGEGKTVKQINLWKDKWEQIPGTGTSQYNPPQFRLKKKPDLGEKKRTEKPVGVSKADLEKAKRERLAGSLGKGHPRTPVKELDRVVNYPWDEKRRAGAGRDFPDTPVPRRSNKQIADTGLAEGELFVEKTGGKVSKSKGGTVKKMHGGKLHKKKTKKTYAGHDGNKYVSKLYT